MSEQTQLARTNHSSEKGVPLGPFHGSQVYILGASFVAALLLTYVFISILDWPLISSLLFASFFPVTTTVILLAFVVDKPEGYLARWTEDRGRKLVQDPVILYSRSNRNNGSKMSKHDAHLYGDAIVSRRGLNELLVTRGISVALPNIANSSTQVLQQIEQASRGMLRMSGEDVETHVKFLTHHEVAGHLINYRNETICLKPHAWSEDQRNARLVGLQKQMENGQLRETAAFVYFTKCITAEGSEQDRKNAIEAAAGSLETVISESIRAFNRCGGKAHAQDKKSVSKALWRHFNPSQCNGKASPAPYDDTKSMLDNYLAGDMIPSEGVARHLDYDGMLHGFVMLRSLPSATHVGQIDALCSLPIAGYSVDVRMIPENASEVVLREERKIAKLRRAYRNDGKSSSASTIEMLSERARRLMGGDIAPYRLKLTVHVWAKTAKELEEKLGTVSMAVHKLNGATPYVVKLPSMSRDLFFAGMPGSSCWEKSYWHYIEDMNAAHMCPAGAHMMPADNRMEALYNASNGALHGISTFRGKGDNLKTLPAFVCGQMGGGKSSLLIDLLTQTDPYFSYTVILDNGGSYETYALTYRGNFKRFVLQSHGDIIFNYLSTLGRALTSKHLDFVTKVVVCMTGNFANESSEREALIFKLVSEFFESWGKAFIERFALPPETSWTGAFAQMTEGQQPTHEDFIQAIEAKLEAETTLHTETMSKLLLHLARWRRKSGGYKLFDGINNVSFDGDGICIELGHLSEASPELNSIATFIISYMVHGKIMNMPRGPRKRVIVEEVGAFMHIPGAVRIINELFQRSRRYNTWVCAVIQQISLLPEDIAVSILGNCRQAFILRQEFEQDVRILQKAFRLSEAAVQQLMRFPDPNPETGAAFLHWISEGEFKRTTVCYNIASPEMLYVADTGGISHDKRLKQLVQHDDILEGIKIEANKDRQ